MPPLIWTARCLQTIFKGTPGAGKADETMGGFLRVFALLVSVALAIVFRDPLARMLGPAPPPPKPNPSAKVWVSTRSGLYYCHQAPAYGSTKPGAYMAQDQALDRGYRPVLNEPCL